jgi:hypothetical protein
MGKGQKGLIALAAGIAAVALGVMPATVGARGASCDKGTLCIWADASYSGQQVNLKHKGISNKLAEKMDNLASSVKNRRDTVAFLYTDTDGLGDSYCVEPHQKVDFLGLFNDVASSTKITAHKHHCPL